MWVQTCLSTQKWARIYFRTPITTRIWSKMLSCACIVSEWFSAALKKHGLQWGDRRMHPLTFWRGLSQRTDLTIIIIWWEIYPRSKSIIYRNYFFQNIDTQHAYLWHTTFRVSLIFVNPDSRHQSHCARLNKNKDDLSVFTGIHIFAGVVTVWCSFESNIQKIHKINRS